MYSSCFENARGYIARGNDRQPALQLCGGVGALPTSQADAAGADANDLVLQAKSKADAAVERLTDVSKYTGSHRQRFDEAGKGRGIAGRKDVQDGSGYVQGYKDKDTYSKTH